MKTHLRKIALCILLTGALASWNNAHAATPTAIELTLESLSKMVTSKNRHVQGARSFQEASESRTNHLLRSYLPTLEAVGGYENFNTGPYRRMDQPYGAIEARVNLFRGGRDALENDVRNAELSLSISNYQKAYLNELTEARREYWMIIFQREMLSILKAALDQNEKSLTAAKRRIQAGIATETDRLEFEMFRVQLEQDHTRLLLANSNSQRILSVLLGLPENTEFKTPENVPHQHDDALIESELDVNTHRDVKALAANQESANAKKSQAYRWWTPSVDVYGNYALYTLRDRDYLSQQDRFETVGGIRLKFDIFDGLQALSEGRSQAFLSEAYEHQAAQTARELKVRYQTAKQELKLTHDLIHSAEKSVEQGKQYLSRTLAEYARGVKNSPDVLGATQKYVEFRRRSAELRKDYQIARTELLSSLGQ